MIQSSGGSSNSLVRDVAKNVASIIGATYGRRGGFAILTNSSSSSTTKDGVSVMTELWSDNPLEQGVIDVIREASMNTLSRAGDGTTTTVVLGNAILERFDRRDFMNKEDILAEAKENIRKMAKKVTPGDKEVMAVALTSTAGDKELSEAIVKAFETADKEGISGIVIDTAVGGGTSVEVTDGVSFSSSPADIMFYDSMDTMSIEMKDARVIVSGSAIEGEYEVVELITKCLNNGIKDVVVIAPFFKQPALSAMMVNHKNTINIVPMTVFDQDVSRLKMGLEVIATSIGASVVGEDYGIRISDVNIEDMALVENMSVKGSKVSIVGTPESDSDKIEDMIRHVEAGLRLAETDEDRDISKMFLSTLKQKTIKVLVGGTGVNSTFERRDRANDCVNAVELALSNGVVPGAGRAYLNMIPSGKYNTDFAGAADVVVRKLLGDDGISDKFDPVDPVSVVEVVAEHAIDLAFMLGMTDTIVIKKEKGN